MKAISCANCGAQLSPGSTSCWACKEVVAAAGQAVAVAAAGRTHAPGAAVVTPTVSSAPPMPVQRQPAVRPAITPAAAVIHAEPILQRSVHGIFSKAEGVRDYMCAAFERELAAGGVSGLVL